MEETLWNVFTYYSLYINPKDPSRLNKTGLYKLCREVMAFNPTMTEKPLSQAELELIYTAEIKAPKKSQISDKLDKLDFQQFVSCLKKVAKKCYPSCLSVEEAMQQFLMDNVLPLANKRNPKKINPAIFKQQSIEHLYKYYESGLKDLYNFYGTVSDHLSKGKHIMLATQSRSAKTFDDHKDQIETARIRDNIESPTMKNMAYIDFVNRFANDFGFSSGLGLTVIDLGDIFLTVTSYNNFSTALRKMEFKEFWEALVHIGLLAFHHKKEVTDDNKVRGLILYMWRNLQISLSEHMLNYGTLIGGGFNTYKGRLMKASQVFNDRFISAWTKHNYRDYAGQSSTTDEEKLLASKGLTKSPSSSRNKTTSQLPTTATGKSSVIDQLLSGSLKSGMMDDNKLKGLSNRLEELDADVSEDHLDVMDMKSMQLDNQNLINEKVHKKEKFIIQHEDGVEIVVNISNDDDLCDKRLRHEDVRQLLYCKPNIALLLYRCIEEDKGVDNDDKIELISSEPCYGGFVSGLNSVKVGICKCFVQIVKMVHFYISIHLLSIILYGLITTCQPTTKFISYSDVYTVNTLKFDESHLKLTPSIKKWETFENPKKLSILSISIDHHKDINWYVPSFHEKYSVGWNRSIEKNYLQRPYACSIRLYGVGLEKELEGYQQGGSGFLAIGFENQLQRKFWHGYDKNETNKLYCYYITNKDTGSEFLDKPKTLGVAIYCPVTLDEEVGLFDYKAVMEQGFYCRPLAEYTVEAELTLQPNPSITSQEKVKNKFQNNAEIKAEFISNPSSVRSMEIFRQMTKHYRKHAVCTVQTFRNQQSGPMLYLFVRYYHLMGWRVIVYDRYGLHQEYLKELIKNYEGFDYYPYTVYQLSQPSKYNREAAKRESTEYKVYYKMEINWGYKGKKVQDTADQDADKTRTYDYARIEYSFLDMILYIDADEIFFCPQAAESILLQRTYQQQLMNEFQSKGIEEMRFVRIPYSGMAPMGFINNVENRSNIDFTNNTQHCMVEGFHRRSILDMVRCWSTGTSYDNFPKSADLASVCPFHYNHWSCDGMKNGGRDFTKNRCRCKVAFDMINGFEYRPILTTCHLMHFNGNKYRFQAKRNKHVFDKGDVTEFCPLVKLFSNQNDGDNGTMINNHLQSKVRLHN